MLVVKSSFRCWVLASLSAHMVSAWCPNRCQKDVLPKEVLVKSKPTVSPSSTKNAVVSATSSAAALSLAAFLLSSTASPASAAVPSVENGVRLFQANCDACHSGGSTFLAEKKSLRKEALEKYQSLDAEKLQTLVTTQIPHNFMPFKQTFTDKDYADVVGYVLDQAVNDKW